MSSKDKVFFIFSDLKINWRYLNTCIWLYILLQAKKLIQIVFLFLYIYLYIVMSSIASASGFIT